MGGKGEKGGRKEGGKKRSGKADRDSGIEN